MLQNKIEIIIVFQYKEEQIRKDYNFSDAHKMGISIEIFSYGFLFSSSRFWTHVPRELC